MNDESTALPVREEQSEPTREKQPYEPPRLTYRGNIAEITMGSGGPLPDGLPGKQA